MAEIVNLRQVRKRKAREDRERTATENRALHGRSKAERERGRKADEAAVSFLDGHKRPRPSPMDEK